MSGVGANAVYGRKGRIGLIVPANNSVIEPELWSAVPEGCALYSTRILAQGDLTAQAVRRMERDVDSAVEAIAATGVDVVAYCDMVTTFVMEPGWNEATMARFSSATGVAFISAWTALRDAFAHLGVRQLALGTPYPRAIHETVPAFFAGKGFTVRAHATLDVPSMREVPTIGHERLAAFVHSLNTAGCEALVLLATDLPTFGSIALLERELGMPVLTSNQTLLWSALSQLGAPPPRRALGRLFS